MDLNMGFEGIKRNIELLCFFDNEARLFII